MSLISINSRSPWKDVYAWLRSGEFQVSASVGAVGGNNHLLEKPRELQEPGTGLVWYQDRFHWPTWWSQDVRPNSPLGVNDGIINGESLLGQYLNAVWSLSFAKPQQRDDFYCVFCINILQTHDNTTRDVTLELSLLIFLSFTHMILIISIFMIRWGHIIQILLSFRKVTVDTRLLLNCPACGILSHHWATL